MNAPATIPPVPAPEAVASWRSYRRLAPYIRPYWRGLVMVLLISALSTALGLAQPYLSKLLIDDALLRRDMGELVRIAAIMVVITLAGFAVNILASYRYVALSAAMLFDIRAALLRHLQTLSPRFYGSFRLGDLVSRINSDVSDVQRIAADTMLSVVSNLLFFVGCVAMMLWLDWRLFLVSIVLVPASLLAFAWCQRRLTALTATMRQRGADLGSLLVDTIMGMRVVASLRAGEHEVARFRRSNDAFVAAMLRMQTASYLAGGLPGTLMTAATSAVILYGGALIIDGRLSIGTLVAFMTYHMRLLSPVQTLMGLTAGLASARVSLGRIFALFDTAPEVVERADAARFAPAGGTIRFEGVSMRYDREPVLADADFTIAGGSICAVLGESGAGKSTMADLMVRYFDPVAGRILIDGQDLRDLRLDDLRREVILVDQAPHLFHDTIAANIAFAMPEASRAEIEAAARAAGLDRFVARLPEGYDTLAGERGLALSAGERQRIVLARAILRRPGVLILDEPTSALDAETEQLVAGRLREALPDATLVIITHKPALARIADSVLTVEAGRVRMTRGAVLADA
ncbi:ABC transporter ATP-binding protein [Novosphingobium album (ex Liu et al. 2023)]|uniref:ABC transporter ATP-binding protein n=1 Tax=Novosphingobium album (ex Liu et al. 2023) TaxID=3031130 RepID=A0ABT5WUK3_9SPHN|nr:ABC transporter ATP-binding protein [Novosphingobium album (ex Liu et al. 2023)]MDE8653577.1 ABC transporter ATP-binding protein [Novosphingobium album (ex Liu et al. 2023)]